MANVIRLLTLSFCITAFTHPCAADDPVLGPPTWIIEARMESDGPRGQSVLIGTVLDWSESRQSWTHSGTIQHESKSVDASRTRSRSIFMLTSDRFTATMNTLKFSRLDGSIIDPDDLPDLLAAKRAVAFVPKGTGIHSAITAAMHPDTIVITRVSYPSDPVVIPLPEKR
ncbi:hypothetical protein FYK55_28195 [Roseiconus nitratireducens]|uniref:Uncharacterized protein n=1 Tax=Roseiconus nitratireducens TaxID=2605748 RepID=A0A5M6CLI4_9BACT|nr:hypothetical protein [Roseiconus nitratireducens]KAA5536078.1 hypothetical protein FYK55_28195 [Roseiconus nitratireducens]